MSKTFGEILKEARKEQNLKAIDVTRATGINQVTYSKYEAGKTKRISIEGARNLCEFLHIDANQLFGVNVDEIVPINAEINYKRKIVRQLKDYINLIKEMDIEVLTKLLEEIAIEEGEDTIEIAYQHEKYFLFGKNDSFNLIPLCCITSLFLQDTLKVIEQEVSKSGFNAKLARLYVQGENILNDILSK